MFCKKITINWQNSKLIILIYFHCKTLSESINLLISKMVHEELRGLLVELPLLHRVLPLLPQHLLPEVHPLLRQVLHHLWLGLDVHVVLKMVNIHEKELPALGCTGRGFTLVSGVTGYHSGRALSPPMGEGLPCLAKLVQ